MRASRSHRRAAAIGVRGTGPLVAVVLMALLPSSASAAATMPTVSAGWTHSCGITLKGTAVCWGSNEDGQTDVPEGKVWKSISAGTSQSCGVTASGEGMCWGSNFKGQGNVPAGKTWKQISASAHTYQACGVTTGGDGFCWGINSYSNLNVPAGKKWKQISAGGFNGCGVTTTGEGLCWGTNGSNQSNVPTGKVWTSISTFSDHSCGVTTEGQGLCWGSQSSGQTAVPVGRTWSAISAGSGFSCGVTTEGDGLCWGWSDSNRTAIPSGKKWLSLGLGVSHACGVTSGGVAHCWGNSEGGRADAPVNSFPSTVAVWLAPTFTSATTGPVNPSRTQPSFSFTGVAEATIQCSIDGASFETCTSPVVPTGLADGSHTIRIRVINGIGDESPVATSSWTVDTSDPAAPTITAAPKPITGLTPTSIAFAGEAGVTFTCSLDGAAYTTCTSPTNVTGLGAGAHTFAVKQTDQAGNTGPAETVTWTVDTTAPDKPGLSGTPSSPTRSTGAAFTITGEANATFTCSLDGAAYTTCASPRNLTGLTDGTHTLAVKQTDEAGNTSPAQTATWIVDTTPPAKPGLSGAPSSPTKSTGATYTITGEINAKFTCSLDGGDYAPCTSPNSLTGLTEGTHTLAVKQTDQAGNTSPAQTATWTIDTTPPEKPGLAGTPTSPTKSTSATFTITGEANAKFTCSLDGATYTTCTSPRNLTGLSEGTHTLSVKQADQAGNTSPAETATWTIDTTPPVAPTLSSGPSGSVYGSTATFGFTGAGAVGFTCALDGQGSEPCTSPATFENLGVGMHTFSVAATDAAGNASSATTRRWTVLPIPPTITSAPSGAVNPAKTPATVTFTGVAGAKFQCSKDKGAWTACTSPFAFGRAEDGPHTLQVRQVVSRSSVSAFVSEAASASWRVDTVAPAKPSLSGIPAANTSSRNATIAITAETGATLECRIDGAAASACSSPVALTDLVDGAHTLAVTATDAVGNVSATAVASWKVDNVAPPAPKLSGQPNPITGLTTATFTFSAESGASLRCSIDGGTWAQCTSPRALSKLSSGDHSFAVKAIDAAGNVSDATTALWTVETKAPPAAVLDQKPDEVFGSTTATFSITPPSYSTMTCALDGAPFTACGPSRTFTGLRVGKHTFQVKVTRGAAATVTSYSWTIDLTVPAKPVWSSAPSGYFGFSGTPGMTLECSIDSGTFAACTSPLKIPTLPDGDHTISIRQKSSNGKVSAPLTGTWTVDVGGHAPTVTGTSVNAFQTLLLGDQRWHVKAQLVFSAGGTNANSQLSLAQVSYSATKPSATPVPTVASAVDGVYAWQGSDGQVPAGEVVVGETIPTWIRVGTVGGQWSDWLAVTTD